MANTRFYENPTVFPLFALVEEMRTGGILLPRFQRPFQWSDEQRLDLLDSIRRGLPIGSFLLWRTKSHRLTSHENLRGWSVGSAPESGLRTYLIDGHQRMMTLLSALLQPDPRLVAALPAADRLRAPVYYNLKEEAVDFPPRGHQPPPWWMPLHVLASGKATFDFVKPLYDAGLVVEADRAETLRNRFQQYWIPVIPIVTEDFETITVGFQRVNSSGTPMGEFDMLHAVIAAKNIDLVTEFESLRERHFRRLPPGWHSIEIKNDDILDATKLALGVGVYEKNPETLADLIDRSRDTIDVAGERLSAVARLLSEQCGVRSLKHLPYRFQLVLMTLAFERRAPTQAQIARIEEWFWRTSLLEVFANSSEGRLNQATKHFRQLVDDKTAIVPPWLEGSVEGPPSSKKDSARLRALRAIAAIGGIEEMDPLLEAWRMTNEAPLDLIRLERQMVKRVGLRYVQPRRGTTSPRR